MNKKLTRTIIFGWTVLSFLIDLYVAVNSDTLGNGLIISLVVIEILICWTAYQMFLGKKWGLIVLTIYYGLRSLNIYTDNFSFYSKSGLNIEISVGDTVGLNLLTLIFFILLLRELRQIG